ncbi:hypothetical protein SAMN04488511_106122 [Pedobacter suwonensis]|uniref:MepB protein n=1 Tax=Pedobacter suwonensis TaxID=332999 RepID=A0A1I0T7L7_9SPHI|nr:MepB family protein [Pedobacter suwonensis]SFA47026.1 hypothetical protein SAMN04488511_106122 [Pedobacter suwonensis]
MLLKNLTGRILSVLQTALDLVYSPMGYQMYNLQTEDEGREYDACTFKLNTLKIKHRTAKVTPTKTGRFVSIWKRNEAGITTPFTDQDEFDLLIISVNDAERSGQFIFPKAILAHHKIIAANGIAGKRGIRVYAPWDVAANKQAAKTQKWQVTYFLQIDMNGSTDLATAGKLIGDEIK